MIQNLFHVSLPAIDIGRAPVFEEKLNIRNGRFIGCQSQNYVTIFETQLRHNVMYKFNQTSTLQEARYYIFGLHSTVKRPFYADSMCRIWVRTQCTISCQNKGIDVKKIHLRDTFLALYLS